MRFVVGLALIWLCFALDVASCGRSGGVGLEMKLSLPLSTIPPSTYKASGWMGGELLAVGMEMGSRGRVVGADAMTQNRTRSRSTAHNLAGRPSRVVCMTRVLGHGQVELRSACD
uniref:Secreted protein n=1 Tax=Knipowitschia caucasica TaxID=637954 RepID=A0AAV2LYB2_KNICA